LSAAALTGRKRDKTAPANRTELPISNVGGLRLRSRTKRVENAVTAPTAIREYKMMPVANMAHEGRSSPSPHAATDEAPVVTRTTSTRNISGIVAETTLVDAATNVIVTPGTIEDGSSLENNVLAENTLELYRK
jgi:hypothetical protein